MQNRTDAGTSLVKKSGTNQGWMSAPTRRCVSKAIVAGGLTLTMAQSLLAQPCLSWTKSYPPNETQDQVGYATAIAVDSLGYSYAGGLLDYASGSQAPQLLMVRNDFCGLTQSNWTVTIDPSNTSFVYPPSQVVADACQNVFACGYRYNYLTDSYTVYLVKFDQNGVPTMPPPELTPSGQLTSMCMDYAGNVLLACSNAAGDQVSVMKYNNLLGRIWLRNYSVPGEDLRPSSIAVDAHGSVYLAVTYGLAGNAQTDLVKYDHDGTISSSWPDSGSGIGVRRSGGEGREVLVDDQCCVYLTASHPSGAASFRISRYDISGQNTWNTGFLPGTVNDSTVAADSVYIAGWDANQQDFLCARFGSAGNVLWSRSIDGPEHMRDQAWAVAADKEGNAYVTGEAETVGTVNGFARTKQMTVKLMATTGDVFVDPNAPNYWPDMVDMPGRLAIGSEIAIDAGKDVFVAGSTGNAVDRGQLQVRMLSQITHLPSQESSSNAHFVATNQSYWSSSGFPRTYNLFNVPLNTNFGPYGGFWHPVIHIDLWFFEVTIDLGEFGAQASASTSGNIGVDLELSGNAGSYDVTYPVNFNFVAPGRDRTDMYPTEWFTLRTPYLVDPAAALATRPFESINGKFVGYLDAHVNVSILAKAFSVAVGGNIINQDITPPGSRVTLLEVGLNNQQRLDVPPNTLFGTLTGYLKVPQVSTYGRVSSDAQGTFIGASGRDRFGNLTFHVTKAILKSIFGPEATNEIHYPSDPYSPSVLHADLLIGDLQSITNLDFAQQFVFRPGVPKVILYNMDTNAPQPVRLANGTIVTQFEAGTDIQIQMPSPSPVLRLRPVFSLQNPQFSNATNAILDSYLQVKLFEYALSASLFGIDLFGIGGCLGCFIVPLIHLDPEVFNRTMSVSGFSTIDGEPFTIVGNATLPEIKAIARPCASLFLFDQDLVGENVNSPDSNYFSQVLPRFQQFVLGAQQVLVYGRGFSPTTQIYMEYFGHTELISQGASGYLNENAVRVVIPNRYFLLPGVCRIYGIQPGLGRLNSIDLEISMPVPNLGGVSGRAWASDPDLHLWTVSASDGNDVFGNATFFSRPDYWLWLQRLYSDTFSNSPSPTIESYFPTSSSVLSSIPPQPTVFFDDEPLLAYREPLPSGFLTMILPPQYVAVAKRSAIRLVSPGPGGGTSQSASFTTASPRPVVNQVTPSEVAPGSPNLTIQVTGPDHVDTPGQNSIRSNFNPDSRVLWNGQQLATTFISSARLEAVVPAALLADSGTILITVSSPSNGTQYLNNSNQLVSSGGVSQAISFFVRNPEPKMNGIDPPSLVAGHDYPAAVGAPDNYNIQIRGTGFVASSIVKVNGLPVASQWRSETEMAAQIPNSMRSAVGTLSVVVENAGRAPSPPVGLQVKAKPVVSGQVTLGDYSGSTNGIIVTFEVRKPNSPLGYPIDVVDATLDPAGHYSIPLSVDSDALNGTGNVELTAKGGHWLAKTVGVVSVLPGQSTTLNLSLPGNGDIDNDNEVGIGDFAVLSAGYNSAPGDPNWEPLADLNGDESVDIADYAILSSHYGETGDNWNGG